MSTEQCLLPDDYVYKIINFEPKEGNNYTLSCKIKDIRTEDDAKAWLGEINEYAQDDVVIMLIGNKADASGDRQVAYEDGERLAREYGVAFMETSAKTGNNVELAFMAVARELKHRMSIQADQESRFNVKEYVRQESTKSSSGSCCG